MPYHQNLADCGVCPPADAFEPDGVTPFYRVVKENPVTSDCFLPSKPRDGVDPCILKAVSIFISLEGIRNGYSRIPAMRNKQGFIATLVLQQHDGMIKQTGEGGHHYSWWRSNGFNFENVQVQIVGP